MRDLVQRNLLKVCHVHTQDQLADLITKALSKQITEANLRNKIGLADISPILREGVLKKQFKTRQLIQSRIFSMISIGKNFVYIIILSYTLLFFCNS